MSELSMMVTITERSKLTTFLSFYRERQVPVQFISLALGTASNETLNYLGLERSDKCVFASFVTDEKWEELRRGLRRLRQRQGAAFAGPLCQHAHLLHVLQMEVDGGGRFQPHRLADLPHGGRVPLPLQGLRNGVVYLLLHLCHLDHVAAPFAAFIRFHRYYTTPVSKLQHLFHLFYAAFCLENSTLPLANSLAVW